MISDDFRNWLVDRNMLPNYRIQYGIWKAGQSVTDKYAVIKNVGGVRDELVRRPQLSLTLIGAVNQPMAEVYSLLNDVVERAKVDFCISGVPFIDPSEPMTFQTEDARPVAELDISFIMSLQSDV
jgi:hypothetical protein